jgi:hypothetical protein
MSSVYDEDNFMGRVAFAANYISKGVDSTRTFDTCFEMNDGDAVYLALVRRVRKNPNTKLAKNIWRYLAESAAERIETQYKNVTDLKALSAQLRAESRGAA